MPYICRPGEIISSQPAPARTTDVFSNFQFVLLEIAAVNPCLRELAPEEIGGRSSSGALRIAIIKGSEKRSWSTDILKGTRSITILVERLSSTAF